MSAPPRPTRRVGAESATPFRDHLIGVAAGAATRMKLARPRRHGGGGGETVETADWNPLGSDGLAEARAVRFVSAVRFWGAEPFSPTGREGPSWHSRPTSVPQDSAH